MQTAQLLPSVYYFLVPFDQRKASPKSGILLQNFQFCPIATVVTKPGEFAVLLLKMRSDLFFLDSHVKKKYT